MSKIVCDICGTTYPDTEEQCPICGCAKDVTVSELADELLEQEVSSAAPTAVFPGRKKKAPVYDEYDDDEYDDDDDEYDDDDDDDDDDDFDEEGFDFGDEDTTVYEVVCACGNVIDFDEETLEKGSIICEQCGETLEFSFDDEE